MNISPKSLAISADWDGNVGAGVDSEVHSGHVIRVDLPEEVERESLISWLGEPATMELVKVVVDGWEEEWDGNNNVGVLSDEAEEAVAELEEAAESIKTLDVREAEDYLFDMSIKELEGASADEIEAEALKNGVYIATDVDEYMTTRIEELQEELESAEGMGM